MGILLCKVLSKLSDHDLQGAVHLVCSEKKTAGYPDETFVALQWKHTASHQDSVNEPVDAEFELMAELSNLDIACSVKSFSFSSLGGPNNLLPKHI